MSHSYTLNIGLETNDGTPAINPADAVDEILVRFTRSDFFAAIISHKVVTSDTEDTLICTLDTPAPFDAVAAILSHASEALHQSAIAALDPSTGKGYLFGLNAGNWGGRDWQRACGPEDCRKGFDPKRFILP